jgi:NADH-quinone oxidoreductase subunit E
MENDNDKLLAVLERHDKGAHSLVPLLQDIQGEFNYLPEEMLRRVAERLEIPLSQVYSVATFYKAFSLEPRGEHIITVCLGTACHVRSAPAVVAELERILGVQSGETTKDMKFTLETVNCLGACALGPIVVMDGEYNGQMTPAKVRKAFEKRYVPNADNI